MRHMIWILPVVIWCALAPARAADCADADTQSSMNICAGKRFESADTALNKTYQALLSRIDEPGKLALTQAETRWLAFRDAQCAFETMGSVGGSVHPFVNSLCLADLTQAQTRRLDRLVHCQEGDVSCGGP